MLLGPLALAESWLFEGWDRLQAWVEDLCSTVLGECFALSFESVLSGQAQGRMGGVARWGSVHRAAGTPRASPEPRSLLSLEQSETTEGLGKMACLPLTAVCVTCPGLAHVGRWPRSAQVKARLRR